MTIAAQHSSAQDLSFPTSDPEGLVTACIAPDAQLDDVPTWSIEAFHTRPSRSAPSYDRHIRDTIGSSYDWGDELRFDRGTGKLTSFVLKTPETGVLDAAIARSWLALPRRPGLPVLVDRERGFHIAPLGLRHLTARAELFIAASGALPSADADSLRLAVGLDTDLLFHHGRYLGWALGRPVAHLVADPDEAAPMADDARLHDLLAAYLALVVEPNITRMSDKDEALGSALRALQSNVRVIDGSPARTLEIGIERVLEVFYPG